MSSTLEAIAIDQIALPGLELAKRKHGDIILVVTDFNIYEIEVLDPSRNVIRISSTDKVLHCPKIAVLDRSVLDEPGTIVAPGAIKRDMRMQIRFADRVYQSSPVRSAALRGIGRDGCRFTYEVF